MKLNIKKISATVYHSIRPCIFIFFTVQHPLYSDESSSIFKRGERFFHDSLYNLAFEQYQKYLTLKKSRRVDHHHDPEAHFKSAICQYEMSNYKEAVDNFEEYIRLYPSESNIIHAMYKAATVRKELGDYAKAYYWFFSIWSRFAGSIHSQHALFEAAFCAKEIHNYDKAVELYQLYYNHFPQAEPAKQAVFSLINLYIDRQNYLNAEETLASLEKRWKYNKKLYVRILYYKSLLAMKTQKIDLAEKYLKSMVEIDTFTYPEKIQAYKNYIEILTSLKKFRKANGQFKKLSEILSHQSPEDLFDLYKLWAKNSFKAGLYKEAVLLHRKILNLFPDKIDFLQIQYDLAECYIGIDDFSNAMETLRKLESADSTNTYSVRAIVKSGELFYNKGLYHSAITEYRRFLQLPDQKNKDFILYKIGKIYQDKFNQYDFALREYEKLITLYPVSPYYNNTVFSIAQCQEKLKEFNSAVRNYEYLCESVNGAELVNEAKKRVLYLRNYCMKNTEAAIFELTELLKKHPSSISTYTRLLRTALVHKKYMKNYKKALEIYKDIEKLQDLPDSLTIKTQLDIADLYNTLHEKATFENDSDMALHTKNIAVSYYNKIINKNTKSRYNDEATYRILNLTSPDISELVSFLKKYPSSRYQVNVLMKIGKYYEKNSYPFNNKFNEKAIAAYKQILKINPTHTGSSEALIGLARNYLKLGRLDSTEIIISQYLQQYLYKNVNDEIYYIKGMLFIKMGKYEEAIDVFHEFLYRYPFSSNAEKVRFNLASVQQKINRTFEALNNFQRYIEDYPNGSYKVTANCGIAKCFVQLGKNSEAKKIFNELLDSTLTNDNDDSIIGDIYYELGNMAKKENNSFKALKLYKTALSLKSFQNKDEVLLLVGDIYFEKKIYIEASKFYAQILPNMKTEVDSVRLLTKLISSLIMSGRTKKAQKRILIFKEKYGKRYKDNYAEIIYYEGTYLLIKKKYDKAINRYKYILNKYADNDRVDDADYQIALIFYYQNKMEEALALFQKIPINYPQSEFVPLAFFKIAMIFHGQDDFVRSAEYFTKVIYAGNIDSKTRFRAANNAAVALQKISSWDEAFLMYKIIISEFSDQVNLSSYHLKAGFCLLQASNTVEALHQFKKAIVNPKKEEKPEILYWIATCYSKLGEYSKAISEYLKISFFSSGFGKWGITAEFEAARLYEKQGEYNKATTLYRKVVRSDGEYGRFGKKALAMIKRLDTITGDNK